MRAVLLTRAAYARQLIPGVLLAATLTLLATLVTSDVPISPVLVAVAIGALWRNVIGVHPNSEAGVQWVTQVLLRIGIALVGARLTLAATADIAALALPVVIACITSALIAGSLLVRVFQLPARLSHLLAVGTAVCGCTAVAALSPTLRARPEETACALLSVVLFGCIGMFCYPWVAAQLFGDAPTHAGVFLGTAIHDTSQVIGAALIHSQQSQAPEVVAAASVTKFLRNMSLCALIPLAAWRCSRQEMQACVATRAQLLPAFVIAFLVFAALRTVGDVFFAGTASATVWNGTLDLVSRASELCLTCGMAAIGLSLSFSNLRQASGRALVAGLVLAALVGSVSLSMTLALLP